MTDQFYTDKSELEKSIMTQMEEFALKYGVSVLFEGRISVDTVLSEFDAKVMSVVTSRDSFIRTN